MIRGLYGILDLAPDQPLPLPFCAALLDGGCRIVQLRMKGSGGAAMLRLATELLPLVRRHGARLIINDRLDVALAAGADGTHLGQDDLPLERARALSPPGFLLGVSTHGLEQARAAVAGGADYVGCGPVFLTATKPDHEPVIGLDGLEAVCRAVTVPVVAIGGITLERVGGVARAGAAAAAIISDLRRAQDPADAARRVRRCFEAAEGD